MLDLGVPVMGVAGHWKRAISERLLAGSAELTYRLLGGRTGERNFSRIVVVAPLGRQNGVASGARLQYAALRQLGLDAELVDAAPALRNPLFRIPHSPGTAYVVHSGGPQAAILLATVLPQATDAYRVAFWAWELPDPPLEWSGCERHFAEIWTPSAFAKASLAKMVDRPIHVVPHRVPAKPRRIRDPKACFTVLAMADSRSSLSRKNPDGALRAFRAAFDNSTAAQLYLKLHGFRSELERFERSNADLLRASNIHLIRGYVDDGALADLYRQADVFLSLHRAEGFGLPMFEAMANGIPVIATGWSGNTDFMSNSDSELIPYTLIPVNDSSAVYAGSMWAEPDICAASCALRRLADNLPYYASLAAAAHQRVVSFAPEFPFAVPKSKCRGEGYA